MARFFISSTYEDLKEARERIAQNLEEMEHENVGMETFTAESTCPIDKCLEEVRSCDLYIGIFAWKYGYIPLSYDKSITELEYREALKTKKECLIFLISERALWEGKFVDKNENATKLDALKKELSSNHTIQKFDSKQNLINQVTVAVSKWDKQKTSLSRKNNFEDIEIEKILEEENQKQALVKDGKKIPYLESNSSGNLSCVIYADVFTSFTEKAYKIEATFNKKTTCRELKKIIEIYYSIFPYGHNVSAFGINQRTCSWFGYGPLNFINTLEMQDLRYKKLKEKREKIHHREVACFIDEIYESIFYIQLQPNSKQSENEKITYDYVNVGFISNKIPYHNSFYKFFESIGAVPIYIDEINESLTISKYIETYFEEEGYVIDGELNELKDNYLKNAHLDEYVRGVFGEKQTNTINPTENNNEKIIVNIKSWHSLEDKKKYKFRYVKATDLPIGYFTTKIINYVADW